MEMVGFDFEGVFDKRRLFFLDDFLEGIYLFCFDDKGILEEMVYNVGYLYYIKGGVKK